MHWTDGGGVCHARAVRLSGRFRFGVCRLSNRLTALISTLRWRQLLMSCGPPHYTVVVSVDVRRPVGVTPARLCGAAGVGSGRRPAQPPAGRAGRAAGGGRASTGGRPAPAGASAGAPAPPAAAAGTAGRGARPAGRPGGGAGRRTELRAGGVSGGAGARLRPAGWSAPAPITSVPPSRLSAGGRLV